jgi:two-component system KDP operon response regulator KdpE
VASKILIIDDDMAFLRLTDEVLRQQGYEVLKAQDGQEALRRLFTDKPTLVLLDVVMPRMDGWQTCQRIRDVSDVPIIMLSGKRQDEEDIVRGLGYGADEYIFKPVGNKELVARVQAALRRMELPPAVEAKLGTVYTDDFLTIDIPERKVIVKGERMRLTPREFRLLTLLVENADHIITHRQALEKVWGWEYADDIDYVRIYISHLRQKIEPEPSVPKYILTEPGVGYYFQKALPDKPWPTSLD